MDEITGDAIEWDYGPPPEPEVEESEEAAESEGTPGEGKA
jgi:hypothetical protein